MNNTDNQRARKSSELERATTCIQCRGPMPLGNRAIMPPKLPMPDLPSEATEKSMTEFMQKLANCYSSFIARDEAIITDQATILAFLNEKNERLKSANRYWAIAFALAALVGLMHIAAHLFSH